MRYDIEKIRREVKEIRERNGFRFRAENFIKDKVNGPVSCYGGGLCKDNFIFTIFGTDGGEAARIFANWCDQHTIFETKNPLEAVILADRWEPAYFRKLIHRFKFAIKELDIKMLVILVTWQGAVQIPFDLNSIELDDYEDKSASGIADKWLREAISSGKFSSEVIRKLQEREYCENYFCLTEYPVLSIEYIPDVYFTTPVIFEGKDYYILKDWKEDEIEDCRPWLIEWLEGGYEE